MEDLKTRVICLWANDERAKNYKQLRKPDEPIVCEYCGKIVYARGLVSVTGNVIWFKPQCDCEDAIKYREEVERKKREGEGREKRQRRKREEGNRRKLRSCLR